MQSKPVYLKKAFLLRMAAVCSLAYIARDLITFDPSTPDPWDQNLIYASNDRDILNACPQIHDVKLITVPEDFKGKHQEADNKFSLEGYMNFFTIAALSPIILGSSNDDIILEIDSLGGLTISYEMIATALEYTKADVDIHASFYAGSSAFLVLATANKANRYTNWNTELMSHAARYVYYETGTVSFYEDIENGYAKENLKDSNETVAQRLSETSSTKISLNCASQFVRGKDDIYMSPYTALKLGFIDAVLNEGTTMTIRMEDERAEAYRHDLPYRTYSHMYQQFVLGM